MGASDVKLFDMVNSAGTVQTDATAAESNFTRITGTERKFTGIPLIDNGMIRIAPWNPDKTGNIGAVPMYGYVNGVWTRVRNTSIELSVENVNTSGKFLSVSIIENTPQRVRLQFEKNYKEGAVDKTLKWTLTVRRGVPTAILETGDDGWSHVGATSSDSTYFYYSADATLKDGTDPADTKTESWSIALKKGVDTFLVPIFSSKQKTLSFYGGLNRLSATSHLKWVSVTMLPLVNSDQVGADAGMWHAECENQAGAVGSGEQGTWTATADAAASAGDMLTGSAANNDRKNFQIHLPAKGYYRFGIQARHENVTSGHELEVILNTGSDTVIDTLAWHTASTAYELKMTRPAMVDSVSPIIGLRNKSGNTTHTWKLDQIVIIPLDRTKDSPPESFWPAEYAHEPLAGTTLVARDIVNAN